MNEPRRELGPALAPLLQPQSVALVGASDRDGSLGTVVLRNLLEAGFGGGLYAVRPDERTVQGLAACADVTRIPAPVDLAVIVTPAATVPAILEDCGRHGVPAAVIMSAGFREAGRRGRELERRCVEVARRHGIRFLGPNCLGVMRPAIGLNATFSQGMAAAGHIALVSQSGALCTAILDWAAPRDVGFSSVVSTGIGADVDFGEILDFLAMDPKTEAVMLYVEGIHDARRFMSALRAASRVKPVIVMKAGRHAEGSTAAVSHSGALAGSDDVFDVALRRAGVVRVDSYADFFAVAETLHVGVKTAGPRLAIVTNGGGPGVMAADHLAANELTLAALSRATRRRLDELLPAAWSGRNPVDVLGDAGADRFVAAVETCLTDDGVDGVLAILVPQAMTAPLPVAERVCDVARGSAKPVLTCWMGEASMLESRELFRGCGLATYPTPEQAVEAFAAAAAHHANQELLRQVPDPLTPQDSPDVDGARLIIEGALAEERSVLDTVESKGVLAAFHVPVVRSLPARDPADALAIAEAVGFPVAMKIHSPDITHKSDVGGVRLGIASGREVRAVYRELTETARARRPQARIEGVVIEPMWKKPHGRELMLGVFHDPVFGPVISVGLGGTMVEVIRDRALGLPPLNRYLVANMIDSTRAARYLGDFRGMPAASREALENAVLRLSEMVCELPEVQELDINPLVVDERGALALDARIVVRRVGAAARDYSHMAIHPYPAQLVEHLTLADGTPLTIRPIRPEDALLEQQFVEELSDRSRYLRFMHALKSLTPEMLSRFTQIDYDREMALIALLGEAQAQKQIGVARYVIDMSGLRCEFAVVVSDRWQGKGIATRLMRRLIGVARDNRVHRMDGLVLRENAGMLALAREIGFSERPSPDDPGVVEVSLEV